MKRRFAEDHLPILITGGAGFIGSNVAIRLLEEGHTVILYDNLSRAGSEGNFREISDTYGCQVRLIEADVLDEQRLEAAVAGCSRVFHFAAQVAVTTSLEDPVRDFEINARGTLNLLEAIRENGRRIPLLFTSTNKVYGDLTDLDLILNNGRYAPEGNGGYPGGIDEDRSIDFHSPYGCSKGAADQYVLDYARTYGLQTVVFRMSCIYGPHQFGTEDQGWVAHFLLQAMRGEPVTLYGDGRQVRDVLFIDDLVEAMLLAQMHIGVISGRAFNIGGGPSNAISLLDLTEMIGRIRGERMDVRFSNWRLADQRYYVSNISRFMVETGWVPAVPVRQGVERLHRWLCDQLHHPPAVGKLPVNSWVSSQ